MQREINKDIRQIKVKWILGLSIREAATIGIGTILGYGIKSILFPSTDFLSFTTAVCITLTVIPLFVLFCLRIYGMSFFDFIKKNKTDIFGQKKFTYETEDYDSKYEIKTKRPKEKALQPIK